MKGLKTNVLKTQTSFALQQLPINICQKKELSLNRTAITVFHVQNTEIE